MDDLDAPSLLDALDYDDAIELIDRLAEAGLYILPAGVKPEPASPDEVIDAIAGD